MRLQSNELQLQGKLRAITSFSAFILLVGQQEGRVACGCSATTIPNSWPNLE